MQNDPSDDNQNAEDGSDNTSDPLKSYPGFGRRHDIFYHYQSPEEDKPVPAPPPPPPIQVPNFPEEVYEEAPAPSRHRLIWALAVILSVGVIILAGFLVHNHLGSGGNSSNTTANQNPDLVDTPCYSFTLSKPHPPIVPSNTCSGAYSVGQSSNSTAGITVSPVFLPVSSVDEMVSNWKSQNKNNRLIAANASTFGNYQTYQLIWQPKGSSSETYMTILSYVPINPFSPTYTDQGSPVYGFQIDGRYDTQDNSKLVYNSILFSWKWK